MKKQSALFAVCQLSHDRATYTIAAAGAIVVGVDIDRENRNVAPLQVIDHTIRIREVGKPEEWRNWLAERMFYRADP